MKYIQLIFIYSMIILNVIEGQNIDFLENTIDNSFQGIHAIKVIDLDMDGDFDIIGGSEITPGSNSIGLHWLRNEGGDPITWTRFEIDGDFEHVMSVDVGDIDNDNYIDVIASSWSLHKIVWWKNSGDPTRNWTSYDVKRNFGNAHDAKCADINGDGYIDVIGVSSTPGSVITCINDGNSPIAWEVRNLSGLYAGALRALPIDLDRDNDIDIIATASDAGKISWWENVGGVPIYWFKYDITTNFIGSAGLYVNDLNGDNNYDIIATAWSSNLVSYWISQDYVTNSWNEMALDTNLEVAASISGGDFDRDGDVDIVAIGKIPGELSVYRNNNLNWEKVIINNDFYGGTALEVIDFDKDGDLDIIAGASSIGKLFLYENITNNLVIEKNEETLHQDIEIFQNYPNPANSSTKIKYKLGTSGIMVITLYDINGEKIHNVINEFQYLGIHNINIDLKELPSGIYYYSVLFNGFHMAKKLLVIK